MSALATKSEIRRFARDARESLRLMEAALRRDDLDMAEQFAGEASGLCGEAQTVIQERMTEVAA